MSIIDSKYIISLISPQGRLVADLTKYLDQGIVRRGRNTIGSFEGVISNKKEAPVEKIFFLKTWIKVEEERNYTRHCIFEGPVAGKFSSEDGINIVAADRGMYWSHIPVSKVKYPEQDTALLAQGFLQDTLAVNPNALPIFKTSVAGSLDSIETEETETRFVADIMTGFPGLIYTFIGRKLFLFGYNTFPEPKYRWNDDTFIDDILLEQNAAIYANSIVVVGRNVIGRASLSPDPDIGLYQRRFDLPAVTQQSVANAKAAEYLRQVSLIDALSPDQDFVLKPGKINTFNDLIPGMYVSLSTSQYGREASYKLMLDSCTVDLIADQSSVGLTSINLSAEISDE